MHLVNKSERTVFKAAAAAFVLMSSVRDSISGYVVDYVTGEPIARQQVQVQRQAEVQVRSQRQAEVQVRQVPEHRRYRP